MLIKQNKIDISYKEICNDLDLNHQEYLSGEGKYYDTLELLESLKKRKNTFLTSK